MHTTNKIKILSKNLFPVVGIGASAGGLEAFKKLIKAIPENSGMAYILVQHLHPKHESLLPEILQRVTKIPVVEISDNLHVEPGHIYVIPSNKVLVATDGILQLSPRSAKGKLHLPIDTFFTSLAEVHQSHAIGVILSGNGADGTLGLKDIKDHGGITFAQDIGSAEYDSMPQHAIEAEIVDFILPPEKIPGKLMELQQSFSVTSSTDDPITKDKVNEEIFRQILSLLRIRVGVDFTLYKQTTIRRRIVRRMVFLKLDNVSDYLDYLKKNKSELDILFQDLLIPVTSFFRDPMTFDNLCETVFPELIKNKSNSNPLRIWVAGCSTGQEAYSMAICIHEYLSDHISNIKVQIFATDISEKSIKTARTGLYSKKELEGISDSRLQQFFTKTDGNYQLKKTVRDMCVFAVHNFLKDPPFAKMDLISCRNVLIYFEPFLQKKALTTFHYALKEKGILMLGKSETTGNSSDLFIPIGKKDKLFTRKTVSSRFTNVASERSETGFDEKNYLFRGKEGKTDDFQRSVDKILLSQYTPAGVVVNEQFDIVQFRGLTGKYLEPLPGKASLNVLKMAKEGLVFEIRNALHKAKNANKPYIKEGIAINNGKNWVTIEVVPLPDTIDLHFLILFREQVSIANEQLEMGKGKGIAAKNKKDEKDIRIEHLEKELAQAREDMHSITEEQEAANEELQSSNEELLSGSEELQSLNEELETSKEELQSTNEELITVNQELFDRNGELDQSRKFANAIISILHEPLLVLDNNYRINSANDSFYKTFHLTEDETLGIMLFELQNNGWNIPTLRKELGKIQKEKEKMIEAEISFIFPSIGERTICFNIQPISRENGEQLILLACDDITLRKKAEQIIKDKTSEVSKERQLLHNFFMQTPALLCILKGPEHVFEFANPLFEQFTGNRKLVGKKLINAWRELEGQGFIEILDKVYNTGEPYIGKEMPLSMEVEKGKTENRFLNFNYQVFKDSEGITEGILVFAYDVTGQVLARRQLEQNAKMIKNLYMNAPAFMCTLQGPKHIYDIVNPSYQKIFGNRVIVGKPIMKALPELEGQGFDKILDKVYKTGETFVGVEIPIILARDENLLPEERYFNFSYQPIFNDEKNINGILVFGYEVTDQMLAMKLAENNLRQVLESITQITITASAEGNFTFFNQYFLEFSGLTLKEAIDGRGWKYIIHPDNREEVIKTMQHSQLTGEDFNIEIRLRRKRDRMYRWQLVRARAIKDDKDKIISWVGAATDIHEQKIKEQKKDEFISIASHEMKTPLTTAKAYLQLIELELAMDSKKEIASLYAKKASLSIARLNELINELLDVSKIQSGKLDYNISTFNFNEMIDNNIEDIQYSSPKYTIIKTGRVDQEVSGDKDRLQQVIINLLNNAIKYSIDTGGKIFINLEQKNNQIIVSVKDNGIGISKQNLEKIFDKYYRVIDHTIESQGLGIGLFISYEIIQRHHGKIWVESEPGKGSTFYFTLPVQPHLSQDFIEVPPPTKIINHNGGQT
jgi:PAS domain S-box-containing protein